LTTAAARLRQHYLELQDRWHVVDRTGDYARLVVPNGNVDEPLHSWFHFKEAFSYGLLPRLLKDAGEEPCGELSLLDPFVGGGTSIVSAASIAAESDVACRAVGIERNPFLWLLCRSKIHALRLGPQLAGELTSQLRAVQRSYRRRLVDCALPPSATLTNPRFFDRDAVTNIFKIRRVVDRVQCEPARDVLLLCLAAAVEPAGRLRRDGRALRYEPQKEVQDVWDTFESKVLAAAEDANSFSPLRVEARVVLGDGRRPDLATGGTPFDWIVFSPPYPNNIDYTEVYKMENWVIGAYSTADDVRAQRLSTVRSHPSVLFPERYRYLGSTQASAVQQLVDPVLAVIPSDRYRRGRRQLVQGYADDMFTVLLNARLVASTRCRLFFVVGNSLHGHGKDSFVIAADLVMARLAELAGWRVEEIRIARHLRRRGVDTEVLRESVVSLRPN
jgi:hypothetical protein